MRWDGGLPKRLTVSTVARDVPAGFLPVADIAAARR